MNKVVSDSYAGASDEVAGEIQVEANAGHQYRDVAIVAVEVHADVFRTERNGCWISGANASHSDAEGIHHRGAQNVGIADRDGLRLVILPALAGCKRVLADVEWRLGVDTRDHVAGEHVVAWTELVIEARRHL